MLSNPLLFTELRFRVEKPFCEAAGWWRRMGFFWGEKAMAGSLSGRWNCDAEDVTMAGKMNFALTRGSMARWCKP